MGGAPTSLDPAHASSTYNKFLILNLYDTLYRYKYLARPYELAPNLATDFPDVSEDGLIYIITIRPGNYFSDDPAFSSGKGREVVASDFVYSILRQFDPITKARGAWLWADTILGLREWQAEGSDYSAPAEGIEAIGRYKIKITLKAPSPTFVHALAQGFAGIVPRDAVEHWGSQLATHPVGSGPFLVEEFRSTEIRLIRNPRWREDIFSLVNEGGSEALFPELVSLEGNRIPMVDRVDVVFIKDDYPRWASLLSGDVDSILAPSSLLDVMLDGSQEIRMHPDYAEQFNLLSSREAGFVHLDFDMSNPEIGYNRDPARNQANKVLRCAIRSGYDWGARNQVFSKGTGMVFAGVIPPIVAEYDPGFAPESIQLDIEGAKARLQGAGWTEDSLPPILYGFASSVTEGQMFEQLRGFLIHIGWPADKVESRRFASFGDYMRALNEGSFGIINSGWEMDYPDATDTLQLFYGPNKTPGANHANFEDPEYDRLFQQVMHLSASEARTALLTRMNQILVDECVTISGLARTRIFIWDKRVTVVPDRGFVGGYFLRFVGLSKAYIRHAKASR